MAWNLRSRPCFAVPPALSPSTMNISHTDGSWLVQSDSLPGSEAVSNTPFLRVSSRALRAASRALGGYRLHYKLFRFLGILFEIRPERVGHRLFHLQSHARIAKLGFGLSLELRIGELDRNDGGNTLANVLARKLFVLFDEVLLVRVVVDDFCE